MEIKYEPVFGDQSLFDGSGTFTGLNAVVRNVDTRLYSFCREEDMTLDFLLKNPVVAMRRVIKTPVISGDIDDLIKDEFSEWWEKEGCLVRSGGGDRERTFAFAAFRKLMPEILAARGLKKTPTWTIEDQKAGKLPEVGSKLIYTETWDAFEFVGVIAGSMRWACKDFQDGFLYFFEQSEMSPIESLEEKAARLREEWCKKAIGCAPISSEMQHYEMKRLGEYIGNIYDALLSGDLPVPVKGA